MQRELTLAARSNPELWAACVAGALVESELPLIAAQSGLVDEQVVRRFNCFYDTAAEAKVAKDLFIVSVNFHARKPIETPAVRGTCSEPRKWATRRGVSGAVARDVPPLFSRSARDRTMVRTPQNHAGSFALLGALRAVTTCPGSEPSVTAKRRAVTVPALSQQRREAQCMQPVAVNRLSYNTPVAVSWR